MIRYQHKITRDLEWVIGSIPLVESDLIKESVSSQWCFEQLERHRKMLENIDNNPPILAKTRFLGKQFEDLFKLWMERSPFYKLLLHNIQVTSETRTISEMDFVVRDLTDNTNIHFETTVKIYLGTGDTNDLSNWIGPGSHDTFAQKLNKALKTQLSAPYTSDGTNILLKAGIENLKSKLFMKGHLFTPYGSEMNLPDRIVPPSPFYRWVFASKLDLVDGRNYYWCVLPKNYWLSLVQLSPEELPVRRWAEILKNTPENVNQNNTAIMLVSLEKSNGLFYEESRLIVVPDNWPN